jgi:signal transduction histidine kinase
MRLSIRAKQITGVTVLVGLVVVVLSALYTTRLAYVTLNESHSRAALLASAILHRVRQVPQEGADPFLALREDPGVRAILESALYDGNVTAAAIVDNRGAIAAHNLPSQVGRMWVDGPDLGALLAAPAREQLRVIFSQDGQTLEVRRRVSTSDASFGSVRIGVSTVLMRRDMRAALNPALLIAAAALVIAVLVALLLSRLILQPIHVIATGLTRLGQGEVGVRLDLPPGDEFGELGMFFNTVSAQLADRAGKQVEPQTAEEQLRSTLAYSRKLVALGRLMAGIAHEVKNPLNAMMIHLELLRTKIRKAMETESAPLPVAAGGTLGLVPVRSGADASLSAPVRGVLDHVEIIEQEIRRLDEVVQGVLKFTRPEELRLEPVRVSVLLEEIRSVVEPEAQKSRIRIALDCGAGVPAVNGDAMMLRQAFLNLAINACQAMPNGGTLRMSCAPASNGRVDVTVEDSGVGIPPENLSRIFDLYFTTKNKGTGIGLSMVYRIVQMHDGEVEVQSTPGRGTTFRVRLPRAS